MDRKQVCGMLEKELLLTRRAEEKLCRRQRSGGGFNRLVGDKIPPNLAQLLESAFSAALRFFLGKGRPAIDKLLPEEELLAEFARRDEAILQEGSFAALRALDKTAGLSRSINLTVTTVEGAGLGLLGVGLPDIPAFLAVLLKTVREGGLRYGFACRTPWEESYLLRLMAVAVTTGEEQKQLLEEARQLAASLDHRSSQGVVADPEEMIPRLSAMLAAELLAAKFVQGLPVVGVAGGAYNLLLLQRVEKTAATLYKGRYLRRQIDRVRSGLAG